MNGKSGENDELKDPYLPNVEYKILVKKTAIIDHSKQFPFPAFGFSHDPTDLDTDPIFRQSSTETGFYFTVFQILFNRSVEDVEITMGKVVLPHISI